MQLTKRQYLCRQRLGAQWETTHILNQWWPSIHICVIRSQWVKYNLTFRIAALIKNVCITFPVIRNSAVPRSFENFHKVWRRVSCPQCRGFKWINVRERFMIYPTIVEFVLENKHHIKELALFFLYQYSISVIGAGKYIPIVIFLWYIIIHECLNMMAV